MANDFINREAVIKEIKAHVCLACPFKAYSCAPEKCGTNAALKAISEIPAADVVEVVRCKDCKYYKDGKLLGPTKFCYYYLGMGLNTADDDFCSKGERRADNGN